MQKNWLRIFETRFNRVYLPDMIHLRTWPSQPASKLGHDSQSPFKNLTHVAYPSKGRVPNTCQDSRAQNYA